MKQTVQIKAGENIFDAAIRLYGSLEGLTELTSKKGLSLTADVKPGQVLEGDVISIENTALVLPVLTDTIGKKTVVKAGQNLFDMAIQEYGDLEGVLILAKDNGQSLTESLEPDVNLEVRTDTLNQAVVNFYQSRELKPATGLSTSENEELKPEGIDYWAIEYDFIVS
ncbi:MAG: hypothetical protein N4A74_21405 [Carboxylicivirga sp.]|jgi:hypothetical protein|nr:hypothetical protein [Carboxylicivirga sp.]